MLFLLCSLLLSLMLTPYSLLAQSKPEKSTSKTPDVTAIQTLRSQSNHAIRARDLTAFGQSMLPEIEVTRGSGSHVSSRDSVLASVSVQFKDSAFLGYVRNTDRIEISTTSPLAAEHGRWTGRFQRSDGVQTITGTYLAMWRKTDAGWRIRSELFVSLACKGSAACGK
ncbi:YybH family protein [Spirosoma validum]|uniref:Nuclear transport factor 2 family protein n=1 Tax=Spirosoma validum TaxID=2771355 RepID=A0A927GEW1_9BACT|nr:nuclear transport factor 2 family protein [Spirosoma validum]MBD2755214.1 nuclear transport factor 2 family protein [Spirosoma validum]